MAVNGEIAVLLSYAAAFGVAWVVSLDVQGLIVSQREMFSSPVGKRYRTRIAAMHALAHALLFVLYYVVVGRLIGLPDFLVAILERFKFDIGIDGQALARTFAIMSSILIVVFVWVTYSEKIRENHRDKLEAGSLDKLRFDVKLLYRWFSSWTDDNFWKFQLATALMVAVDMLAVTAFIRVFFKTAKDTANLKDGNVPAELHFDFGLADPRFDFVVFAVIVAFVVYLFAMRAIRTGEKFHAVEVPKQVGGDDAGKLEWKLMRLRFLEPVLVFACLAMAIDHLFGIGIQSISSLAIKFVVGIAFSFALTGLLVAYNGYNAIKDSVMAGASASPSRAHDFTGWAVPMSSVRPFVYWLAAIFLSIVVIACLAHLDGVTSAEGAKRFLKYMTAFAGIVTVVVLYSPFKAISVWEEGINERYLMQELTGVKLIIFCFIVYAMLYSYLYSIGSLSGSGSELTGGILLDILGVCGVTTLIASFRAYRLSGKGEGLNLAEWLAAVALAILVLDLPHLLSVQHG